MNRWLIGRGLALVLLALVAAPSASAQQSRPGALILDARSGRVLARVPINELLTSAVPDGRGGWYVGGFFTRIGGQPRRGLARVLPNGVVDPGFQVPVTSSRGNRVSVGALARAGHLLYVGCACGLVGGMRRPGLAAIDLRTRAVLRSFEPGTYIDIQRLAVTRRHLLVARQFSYPVPGVSALDLRTGAPDRDWDPRFKLIGDAGGFHALVVRGSRVYVAGSFRVSGLPRNGLVALEARTGAPDPAWAPEPPDCSVCVGFAALYALAVSDERVYVSGFFTLFDGFPRNGIVALDWRTGAVDRSWRPATGGQGIIALALVGRRLYLGTTEDLGSRRSLSVLDAETGASLRAPELPFRNVLLLSRSGRRLLVAGR